MKKLKLTSMSRRLLNTLLLITSLVTPGAALAQATPATCGPSPGGAPCEGTGPASLGNQSQTNLGAGNPINVVSGNKYQQEVDMPPLPGVLGLEIIRHYNSAYAKPNGAMGSIGRGWRLSYETDLYAVRNTLQVMQADGTRLIFIRDPKNPNQCASQDPAHGQIHIRKSAYGEEYTWDWANGRRLTFNHQGKLTQIVAPSGEALHLTRNPQGLLVKVTDPQGRQLRLEYAPNNATGFSGITAITSPVGRFVYQHPNDGAQVGNLTAVTFPGLPNAPGVRRHYHYEDVNQPTLLTGISLQSTGNSKPTTQRLSTWDYDHQGRAVLSYRGEKPKPGQAGIEQVRLQYSSNSVIEGQTATTLLTNSLGQKTNYKHGVIGNEYRLIEVAGVGCASCGEVNVRYGYDDLGRLIKTTKLDTQGQAIHSNIMELDRYGRTLSISRLAYTNGKPGKPQRQVRVEYAMHAPAQANKSDTQDSLIRLNLSPILIARPSVIPGKEVTTRITYNERGQPTEITESGYAPVLPEFKPVMGLQHVRASTNGLPSQLNRGPHALTPTHAKQEGAAAYQASLRQRGDAVSTSDGEATPITRTTRYRYHLINRRSLLVEVDGPLKNGPTNSPKDSDITRYEWDGRGSFITTMTTPGGFTNTMQYDEVGRTAAVSNAQGFKTIFDYDARSQLIRLISSGANWAQAGIQPVVHSFKYDALGNRIETGMGDFNNGNGSKDKAYQTYRPQTRQAFDVSGRLLWQAEALGILKRAQYDTEGHLLSSTVSTKSFAQSEHYRYDHLNRLVQVVDNTGFVRQVAYDKSPTNHVPNTSSFQTIMDDFGRVVATISVSHGSIINRYNAANQLVEQANTLGDVHHYAYDLAGQRVRYTVLPKTGEAQTTTWRYEHGRLIEVKHPNQSERIHYNERGQPVIKTVTLKLVNGAEATHVTRYAYAADGALASESLPDGTKVIYERNGQGQIIALSQQMRPLAFFGWGRQTIVKDLERDLIGLRSTTYGNGVQGQWQRSKAGVLARVVYTQPRDISAQPLKMAAVSPPSSSPYYLRELLGAVLPEAHAQAPNKFPGALGIPANRQALFDARLLYDEAGNVLLQKQQGHGIQATQAYAYDSQNQLIAAQATLPNTLPAPIPVSQSSAGINNASVWRYNYDSQGNRVLAQEHVPVNEMGQTRKTNYHPQSNVLITQSALGRDYVWNALGQLTAIREQGKDIARYRYNYRGLRISKESGAQTEYTLYNEARQRLADLNTQGQITRQYIWLGDRLVATLDAKQPKALQAPVEGFAHNLRQTAQLMWRELSGDADRLAFVHGNHLGAPIAATNAQGQTLWQADYAPYGKLIKTSALSRAPAQAQPAAYHLALRLPGQWEDQESGLYYNDARYYDPKAGRYLTPDPLGKLAAQLGSPNAYAYVNNNPLSYIDPYGLILFAFDGTGNDESNHATLSNVVKFRDLYQDGQPFYITGPGTLDPATGIGPAPWDIGGVGDIARAYTGPARIMAMIKYLGDYSSSVNDETAFDVDITGFSRGAAEAREFANRIAAKTRNGWYSYTEKDINGIEVAKCQKLNFRFMGLFDTVLSTHTGSYQLNIPNNFRYVAQAVALNEYRGAAVAFPLESIMGRASPAGVTRIERGFLGSHSDIGGGFPDGDLARVALIWMVDQARTAGVNMANPVRSIVSNPVLHDKSSNLFFGAPSGGPTATSEDRTVRYTNGATDKQRHATTFGMSYADTKPFIAYKPNPNSRDSVSGTVDMQGYLSWLNSNGYNINMTIQ